jgi:hypothetical protein
MTVIFGRVIDDFSRFQVKKINESELIDRINNSALIFVYVGIVAFFSGYFLMACWAATGER